MSREEQGKQVLEQINLRQVQKNLGKGTYIVGNWEVECSPDDMFLSPFDRLSPKLYTTKKLVELHLPDGVKVTIEKEVTEWRQ